jgi:WD40 repeat protein
MNQNLEEKFYIYNNFINSNSHILQQGDKSWDSSKIFFQLANEHAKNSPLTNDAKEYENSGKVDFEYAKNVNIDQNLYISPIISTLTGNSGGVMDVKILSNGNILSFSNDNKLRIWDKNTFECKDILEPQNKIKKIATSSNGDSIILFDNKIELYSQNNLELIKTIDQNSYENIKVLQNKNILAYSKNIIKIYDANSLEELHTWFELDNEIKKLEILENFIISYFGTTLKIMNENGNDIAILDNIDDDFKSIKLLTNGDFISYGWKENSIKIWDQNSFEQKQVINEFKNKIDGIEFIPNGNIIAYAYNEFDIKIFDKNSFETIAILTGHQKISKE